MWSPDQPARTTKPHHGHPVQATEWRKSLCPQGILAALWPVGLSYGEDCRGWEVYLCCQFHFKLLADGNIALPILYTLHISHANLGVSISGGYPKKRLVSFMEDPIVRNG